MQANGGSGGYNLGDLIYSDHILEGDEAVGKALLGTYVYKSAIAGGNAGYPKFYDKYVAEKAASTPTQVTLGDNTITMYIHPNGHKFYDIADKDAVDAWYEKNGKAYFFGIDTENERIFLPRKDLVSFTPKDKIKVYGDGDTLALTNDKAKVTGISSLSGYGNAHYFVPFHFTTQCPIGTKSGTINESAAVSNAKSFGLIPKSLAKNGITSGVETDDLSSFQDTTTHVYMVVGNTSKVTKLTTNIADDEVLQQINKNTNDVIGIKDLIQTIDKVDYTNAISLGLSTTPCIIPADGIIAVSANNSSTPNTLTINNTVIGGPKLYYSIALPVSKGDSITSASALSVQFIPRKGVN